MDTLFLCRQLLRLFKTAFPNLHKPYLKMLSRIVVAFWFTDSIRLWRLASYLPFSSPLSTKNAYKALVRFLDKFPLDQEFWKNYVRLIFSLPYFRLKRRKYITILIDATTIRDEFWILMGTISFMGRGIPIYMKVWKDPNSSYDYWGRVERFLRELKGILPKRKRYEIVADRGFQGDKLVRICKDLEWDYLIRINGNYKVKIGDKEYIQLSLFKEGIYYDVVVGKRSKEVVNLVANEEVGEGGEEIKWYLKTSLMDKETAVRDYMRRMWIEEGIKDLKQYLKWESFTKKVPESERVKKLLVISILSYVLGLCMGVREEVVEGGIDGEEIGVKREEGIYRRFKNKIAGSIKNIKWLLVTIIVLVKQVYPKVLGIF